MGKLVPFMGQLRPETVRWIRERSQTRSFRSGESLFVEGDEAHGTYIIERGLIRIERFALNGQQHVLTLAARGEVVGNLAMLDGATRSASAVAMQPSDALAIPAQHMQHALQNFPDVPLATARVLADRLKSLTDQLIEATGGTARSRTASRLVQLIDDGVTSGPVDIAVNISQAELAAWAGLSREGVVKALRELRDLGIVETSRKHIGVLDVAGLRTVGEASD